MRKFYTACFLICLMSCRHHADFGNIKPGMHRSMLIKYVGAPTDIRHMGSADWWLYDDPQRHLLVVEADTLVRCTTQQEAMDVMTQTLNQIDSARHP